MVGAVKNIDFYHMYKKDVFFFRWWMKNIYTNYYYMYNALLILEMKLFVSIYYLHIYKKGLINISPLISQ